MNQDLNIKAARDVLELISILKAKAKAERGIELHTEVEIIGKEIL
ncbi:MAG TPA: hypothetical protein VGM58_04125 [Verrucomicrobiae bacterium]|jgi:UDP-N-acetylenolpyruvoylglucosamine reductase